MLWDKLWCEDSPRPSRTLGEYILAQGEQLLPSPDLSFQRLLEMPELNIEGKPGLRWVWDQEVPTAHPTMQAAIIAWHPEISRDGKTVTFWPKAVEAAAPEDFRPPQAQYLSNVMRVVFEVLDIRSVTMELPPTRLFTLDYHGIKRGDLKYLIVFADEAKVLADQILAGLAQPATTE